MTDENNTKVDIELSGAMEIKPLDIEPFIGQKAEIESLDYRYNKQYDSYFMTVKTKVVTTLDNADKTEVRASRNFGLRKEGDVFGWKLEGDLDNFLKSCGVSHPKELIGKKVVLLPTKPNKDGTQFLTF